MNLLKQLEPAELKGVTSNPSIFQKAIGDSDSYAATMQDDLVKGDHSIVEIYEHLAVDDMPNRVFGETDARNGYVRPDYAPYLANDPEGNGHQPPRAFRRTSGRLAKEVRAVDASGADWIHVDVMDGRFSDAAAQEAP